MKGIAIAFGALLALIGCSRISEEDALENMIRAELSQRDNVQRIELTKRGDNEMTGFVIIREADGGEKRLNCRANRTRPGAATFAWRCVPAAGTRAAQRMLEDMKASIRQAYAAEAATVLRIELSQRDDDHVVGFLQLRDSQGVEARHECTATRDPANHANIPWRCEPPGGVVHTPAGGEGAPMGNVGAGGQ